MPPGTYSLTDLAQLAGVSDRTIRYYVQQGLLLAPLSLGPGAPYPEVNLLRLRAILRLRAENLPLAEIRRRLETMAPDELAASGAAPASALDYIRALRGEPAQPVPRVAAASTSAPQLFASAAPGPSTKPEITGRAQWDRFTLSPDVELHVRRPLTRETARRVRELIDQARALFEGEQS